MNYFIGIVKINTRGWTMISYMPLWDTLNSKGHSTYWLLKQGIDNKTLYNLKHNKNTTLLTIEKLCTILDCRIEEIVTFEPENN